MAKIGIKTSAGIVPFNGGSGGGHTIVDDSGTSMTQRSNLKFVGASITDDSENDTTIVEVDAITIVQIPSVVVGSHTYDGTEQSPTITGLDTTHTVITGTTSATNAGNYTFTIALKDPTRMVWADLTTADRSYEWSISKAYGWTLLDYINGKGTKTSQADIDDYVMVALFQRSGTNATGNPQGGVLVPTGIFKERAIASEYASPVQATYSNNGIDLNSGNYGLQLWGHNTGDLGEYELIGQATNETKNISSIDLSEYAEILLLFIAPNETRALNSVMLPIGLFTSLCGTAPLSCSWDQRVHGSSSYAKVTYVSNSQITLQGASCTAMVYGIKGISRTSTYLGESTQSTTGNVQTTIDNINLYKELLFMCMSSSKNRIYNLIRLPISLVKNIQEDKVINCILANNTTASYMTYINDTTVKFTGQNATQVLYGIS